jgi:alpha-ketoglutarate-dependent taurine dioxygenase
MAELDPDQEAALRRLRAAFGFIVVLRIVDHEQDQDQDDDELPEEGKEAPAADR